MEPVQNGNFGRDGVQATFIIRILVSKSRRKVSNYFDKMAGKQIKKVTNDSTSDAAISPGRPVLGRVGSVADLQLMIPCG